MKEATVTGHEGWVSYSGSAEIVLAVILAAAAAAVAYAGIRLPLPARPPRPGAVARIIMVAAWVLAIAALLVSVAMYETQVYRAGLGHAPASNPITPVTLTSVGILFAVIVFLQKASGWRAALLSARIGAVAAPMIFEVPFNLIIMARSHPVIDPALYRPLLFGTLIGVGVTTLVLLPLSPAVRLRRATLWCLAGMLAAFAVWSLFGFAYPDAPGPITLNVVSKLLAFATALTLFLPERARPKTPRPAQAAEEVPT